MILRILEDTLCQYHMHQLWPERLVCPGNTTTPSLQPGSRQLCLGSLYGSGTTILNSWLILCWVQVSLNQHFEAAVRRQILVSEDSIRHRTAGLATLNPAGNGSTLIGIAI